MRLLSWINRLTLSAGINQMNMRTVVNTTAKEFPASNFGCQMEVGASQWKLKADFSSLDSENDAFSGFVRFTLEKGTLTRSQAFIDFRFDDWSRENYVLLPAAVYDGNRFDAVPNFYPPFYPQEKWIKHPPTLTTDILRLSKTSGESQIHCLSGDMSTPAFCVYDDSAKRGFILLFEQHTELPRNTGVLLREEESNSANFILTAPGVREKYYRMGINWEESSDLSWDFTAGDTVTIRYRLYDFACNGRTELLSKFFDVRKSFAAVKSEYEPQPLSKAYSSVEDKMNRLNWKEDGFYNTSLSNEGVYQGWWPGWCGGGTHPYAFWLDGQPLSKERAVLTTDFRFDYAQSPEGLLYACFWNGRPWGDNFSDKHEDANIVLTRRISDDLYWMAKQFTLIRQQGKTVPEKWENGMKRLADALTAIWEKESQFGQYLHIGRQEVLIGGSASAAITSAALALCSRYFDNENYLKAASESAEFYCRNFLHKGYTNGGPGEALQCPDSESAFGLLESCIIMYECTGEVRWLEESKNSAHLCATWCTSYDYDFPVSSQFEQLRRRTTGSVWANAQNKHAAPGICTLSGSSLLKLFRASGDIRYLELLSDIVHCVPRYLPHKGCPIHGSQFFGFNNNVNEGYIDERVNMSDWETPSAVGELPGGSTWAEMACLLTYAEIPGIYCIKDKGFAKSFDAVEIVSISKDGELKLRNVTDYVAKVKIFAENSADLNKPLFENYLLENIIVTLSPGQTIAVQL